MSKYGNYPRISLDYITIAMQHPNLVNQNNSFFLLLFTLNTECINPLHRCKHLPFLLTSNLQSQKKKTENISISKSAITLPFNSYSIHYQNSKLKITFPPLHTRLAHSKTHTDNVRSITSATQPTRDWDKTNNKTSSSHNEFYLDRNYVARRARSTTKQLIERRKKKAAGKCWRNYIANFTCIEKKNRWRRRRRSAKEMFIIPKNNVQETCNVIVIIIFICPEIIILAFV